MSGYERSSKFKSFFNFVMSLLPILGLIYGVYFIYTSYYLRGKFNKTYDDIRIITKNIRERDLKKYKNFNNGYAVLTDILPYDMKVYKNSSVLYNIKNRFGGNIYFHEGLNSEAERVLYYGLINNHAQYKDVYTGVSSYILFFTGLNSYECRVLASYDWAKMLPNYIAIEVSALKLNRLNDGLNKLKTSYIPDAQYDDIYGKYVKDKGYISKIPLNEDVAKAACSCKSRNCTFAIKLK